MSRSPITKLAKLSVILKRAALVFTLLVFGLITSHMLISHRADNRQYNSSSKISESGDKVHGIQRIKLHDTGNPASMVILRENRHTYHVYFSNRIGNPLDYLDLLVLLPNLSNHDTVVLNLSGYGGDVSGTMPMLTALKNTDAKVIANVTGNIYSAHAYLTCSADEIHMKPETMMMFHMTSAIRNPMLDEYTKEKHKVNNRILLKKYCSHLITEVDTEAMAKGSDIYYSAAEISKMIKASSSHKFKLVE